MPGYVEIKNIEKSWVEAEKLLMNRLHRMITCSDNGGDDGPFEKDSGYKWQLDASNDWWAELRGDTLVIAHRYKQEAAYALGGLAKHFMAR